MKTLLFLHREDLSDLYILIAKYLEGKMNILHIAYSDTEVTKLQNAGIINYYNYSELLKKQLDNQIKDADLLQHIDLLFIKNTGGRFNLNSSLQSDRGYQLLTYEQTLQLAQAHYVVWNSIFNDGKVDFLLHEACSLYFNHLAAVMCKEQGGVYLWQAQAKGEADNYNYLFHCYDDYSNAEIEHNVNYYLQNVDKIDVVRCSKFIATFREDFSVFLSDFISLNISTCKLRFDAFKEQISSIFIANKYNIILNNIEYWINKTRFSKDKLQNAINYKKYNIKFEDLPEGEKYYYYSFHLEPEAVVLYLGDGIYTNQVKLIENIASSLPVGYYLYVKDHPHEFAYRRADDYERLAKIPNVRLLKQSIPGKMVIKNAIGVFTINGTAGFEALILGKQVYCFGWNYYCYSDRVKYIKDIRSLRDVVYSQINLDYKDDTQFMAYINAYLDSIHKGYICYFMSLAKKICLDEEENAQQIAEDLLKYSERFCK